MVLCWQRLMKWKTDRVLCVPPVQDYTPTQIKRPRKHYITSQVVFAACLNASPSTVRKREEIQKKPNGPSRELLNLVDIHGL